MIYSEGHILILEALEKYRYLTAQQVVEIGIFKTAKTARDKYLSFLKNKRKAPVRAIDYGIIAGVGRLPQIYHLTKYGAEILAEINNQEAEKIKYPIGKAYFSRDYFHRREFISLHIAFRKYAERTGQAVDFWHSYFDSTGNQRQANSQIIRDTQVKLYDKTIIPDGNFKVEMNDGESRLFTLELHRGNHLKTIIKQLETHARLIELELLPEKYDHPNDNYILTVYEDKKTMENIKNRFLNSRLLSEYKEYYIFNTTENIKENFVKGWHYFNNEPFLIFTE